MPFQRAQKSLDFQGPTTSQLRSKWICPHQKHYVHGRINHRSINTVAKSRSVFSRLPKNVKVCVPQQTSVFLQKIAGQVQRDDSVQTYNLQCVRKEKEPVFVSYDEMEVSAIYILHIFFTHGKNVSWPRTFFFMKLLPGLCHEIFKFRFFSRRYSQLKVHHQGRWLWWQITKKS
jgi:hypothetical protein